jgi:hypothetical protein
MVFMAIGPDPDFVYKWTGVAFATDRAKTRGAFKEKASFVFNLA